MAPPGTSTFAILGFDEELVKLFRGISANAEVGVDTTDINTLVGRLDEIKLAICEAVGRELKLKHGNYELGQER